MNPYENTDLPTLLEYYLSGDSRGHRRAVKREIYKRLYGGMRHDLWMTLTEKQRYLLKKLAA